jgi:hypothetical protein
MDSGKIESVQLPSGRHRFTKKQIEDFLYKNNIGMDQMPSEPSGVSVSTPAQTQSSDQVQSQPQPEPAVSVDVSQGSTDSVPQVNVQVNPNENTQDQTSVSVDQPTTEQTADQPAQQSTDMSNQDSINEDDDAQLEAELDELLKSLDESEDEESNDMTNEFDELSKSLEPEESLQDAPAQPQQSEPAGSTEPQQTVSSEPAQQPVQQTQSVVDTPAPAAPAVLNENAIKYYYCPYNDLKTVAKMVKKVGDDENVDYAFTMNAGLSLFFPLEPFSVIHFYVKEGDMDVWAKNLQLKESNSDDANLGILVTRGDAFSGSREVSGLKVVSKNTLINNLNANGKTNLASEAEQKLD